MQKTIHIIMSTQQLAMDDLPAGAMEGLKRDLDELEMMYLVLVAKAMIRLNVDPRPSKLKWTGLVNHHRQVLHKVLNIQYLYYNELLDGCKFDLSKYPSRYLCVKGGDLTSITPYAGYYPTMIQEHCLKVDRFLVTLARPGVAHYQLETSGRVLCTEEAAMNWKSSVLINNDHYSTLNIRMIVLQDIGISDLMEDFEHYELEE